MEKLIKIFRQICVNYYTTDDKRVDVPKETAPVIAEECKNIVLEFIDYFEENYYDLPFSKEALFEKFIDEEYEILNP